MVKRTALIRVTTFLLLASCGALCQELPSYDLFQGLQFEGSNSPETPRQDMPTWRSLPDAPSAVEAPTQAERFHSFVNESRLPLTLRNGAGAMPKAELGYVTLGAQPSLLYRSEPVHKESGASAFLRNYLRLALPNQDQPYSHSTGSSFLGRTGYAASRIFITRDGSGKGRLNPSYFIGVLTASAVHSAYRPYWARSTSATFNDFGSTIGSDAGINVFHEFAPGIRQIVKGHVPKFVSIFEERISHDHPPRNVVSMPAR